MSSPRPQPLPADGGYVPRSVDVELRQAESADVAELRLLLADDVLGAAREDTSPEALPRYERAFQRIADDDRSELWVAVVDHRIVGMYQVNYIPYLSRAGNERALIEGVRVAADFRNGGIGEAMMRHALAAAKSRGCLLAQLTSDKSRADAHRFYEKLGFKATHEGMKLDLTTI